MIRLYSYSYGIYELGMKTLKERDRRVTLIVELVLAWITLLFQ